MASNKKEFLEQLEAELKRIGVNDCADITEDFERHFAEGEAEGLTEEETAARLGDVKEIARNYLNLESSRINSMIARDIENSAGKVSLTKEGRDVPADLNLIDGGDKTNGDFVREYTPEHISEEIYPNNASSGNSGNSGAIPQSVPNAQSGESAEGSQNGSAEQNNNNNQNANQGANKNDVADAFSNAGKAIANAALVTGQAIADAFENSGLKEKVTNAGQNAVDAVKRTAAAERQKNADREARRADRDARRAQRRESLSPKRSNTAPDGSYIPENSIRYGERSGINTEGLTPKPSAGRIVGIVLLDVFLWSWLLILIASCVIAIFASGVSIIIQYGIGTMTDRVFHQFYLLSRIFLGVGLCCVGAVIILISVNLVKPFIKLLKYIGTLHVKAWYGL